MNAKSILKRFELLQRGIVAPKPHSFRKQAGSLLALSFLAVVPLRAATLTAQFASIPVGSAVNLTPEGRLDWVHWGLYTEGSIDRKAGVTPQIGDFRVVGATNTLVNVYRYRDNYNGYSWDDGTPNAAVTYTPTGLWAYAVPATNSGFELTVPADTALQTFTVYVGAYGAVGRLEAYLSDTNVPAYTDTSLDNSSGNGPSGTYTISYAADAAGQTLKVRWTLLSTTFSDGNVTLQAATLSAPGANNPPRVTITSPTYNASVPGPADITINAEAFDTDGTVQRVEYFEGANALGESSGSPYAFTWRNVPPGHYTLTAKATDDGGKTAVSSPIELFVNGTGGSLGGSVKLPPATVDLTGEGALDWAHWGLRSATTFNHKSGVQSLIANFVNVGTNNPQQYKDNYTAYSWTDGTPTKSTTDTKNAVYVQGLTNGFSFTVPADRNLRTLKVYVGLYGAQGNFQAHLSDFSAPAYADMSLGNDYGNDYGVFTLTYAAATAGQALNVKYTARNIFDFTYGNVTLQAATLSGASAPSNALPVVAISSPTNNAAFTAPATVAVSAEASDPDGSVTQVEFFDGSTSLGVDAAPPFGVTAVLSTGTHTLTAKATDNQGATTTSAPVTVVITAPNQLPAVAIVNPADGATFAAPATIAIDADASDSDGSVTLVEFFRDSTKIGEVSAGPFTFVWTNVPAGAFTLTARATDNNGAATTSSPISITVTNATIPAVTLIDPAYDGTQFSFSFATELNRNYAVESTLALGPLDWKTLLDFTGDGTMRTVTDSAVGGEKKYYRVRVQ